MKIYLRRWMMVYSYLIILSSLNAWFYWSFSIGGCTNACESFNGGGFSLIGLVVSITV